MAHSTAGVREEVARLTYQYAEYWIGWWVSTGSSYFEVAFLHLNTRCKEALRLTARLASQS